MIGVGALVFAALFTGAALYVLLVEHPARQGLDPAAQLAEWKPAYARGTLLQAPLALLAGAAGLWLGAVHDAATWTTGGIVMLGAIGWTFAAMWRLNTRLKRTTRPDDTTVAQLATWGRLHAIRTLFGVGATLCYAQALTTTRP